MGGGDIALGKKGQTFAAGPSGSSVSWVCAARLAVQLLKGCVQLEAWVEETL